jgi:metallo-beta-lactamase class B
MPTLRKFLQITTIVANLLLISFSSNAQKFIQPPVMQANWSQDYEPFRIAGNLYYVGTYDLACYLIATPKGLILINTGLAGSVPMIRAHVQKLGFKFSDIKILLATHAHYDHVAGMAEIKKLTGAKMMINENDAPVLADGGNSDYSFGGKGRTFASLKADRVLHEHDTVKFGGMQIAVIHLPGHTKGASGFLFDVKDEHRKYRVFIANMPSILEETKFPGMPTYPNVAKDYAHTFDVMKKVHFDIWLASHASQFDLHKKHKPGDAYNPTAFMGDQKGYDAAVDDLYKAYLKKLGKK